MPRILAAGDASGATGGSYQCSCASGWTGAHCETELECQPGPKSCTPFLTGAGTAGVNGHYTITGTQNDHTHYTNVADVSGTKFQIYYGLNGWQIYGPREVDYYKGRDGTYPPTTFAAGSCYGGCHGSQPTPTLHWRTTG